MKHRGFVVVPAVMAAVLTVAAPVWAQSEEPPPTTEGTTTTTTAIETPTTTVVAAPSATTTTIVSDASPVDPPVGPAATPAIVVTPSTDLVHNQSVTVTGSGYTPNASIGLAQCEPDAAEPADCDLGNIGYATADAAGAWSTTFTVRRVIRNSYETIDCTTAPGACVIGAANLADYSESGGAPLAFDPTVPPPPPPALAVNPSTGLAQDQPVFVTGSGFPPNRYLNLVQCIAGSSSFDECDYSGGNYAIPDGDGRFTAGFHVRRVIFTNSTGRFDCGEAAGACEIVADASDPLFVGRAAISFDLTQPPPPPPVVSVTPSTDLVHNQVVTVAGSGFTPNAEVGISQCEAGGAPVPVESGCDLSNSVYTQADAEGAWTVEIAARRVIRNAYETVDCSTEPGACVIAAASFANYAESANVPVAFDPSVPPPPPPVLTLSPSTGLVHNQTVTMTGRGFAPHREVSIIECLTDTVDYEGCDYSSGNYVQTDDAGEFTIDFGVRRVFRVYSVNGLEVVDCLEATQGCELRVEDYTDVLASGRVSLGFDPDAPLPPPPALEVTPSTGLVNRQTVEVSGAGWAPNEEIQIAVCAATTAPPGEAPCDYVAYATTDAGGSFAASVKVRRVLFGYEAANVDCATTDCVLRAESYSDALGTAEVPIGFDDSVPPPPPYPEITVSPATALSDGQAVTLTGLGFSPFATVSIGQCTSSVASEDDCDPAANFTVETDGNGGFTANVVVRRVIHTNGGATVDCGERAGRCLIGAANVDDLYGEYDLSTGLEFAPAPQPSPPVVGGVVIRPAPTATSTSGTLPRTGAELRAHTTVAVLLLVVGLLMTALGRRLRPEVART